MRVFVGLSVPDRLSLELIGVRDRAVAQMISASPRPVIAANFHMTLLFFGEVSAQRKNDIAVAIDRLVSTEQGSIRLQLDRACCFADAGGRVFVAEAAPVMALSGLHQRLQAVSTEHPARSFRPHITLARLPRAFIPAPVLPLNLPFEAAELCLYESRLSEWGVRYRVLRRWPLPTAQ